ncbi:MAG TPA: hypothetical protein VFQ71_05200 [Gaiellales bacterium]|nr:hypothetical protein [Gaiellales bacterium]
MLLHHVHLLVPDVPAVEEEYAGAGFAVVARYGYVGQEHEGFGPEVGWDELRRRGFRLRLVELEQGAVNVVLMPARFPERRLGHIGAVADVDERDRALAAADRLGRSTRGGDVRKFVRTGGGFELELTDSGRADSILAGTERLRIERLEIACPDTAAAAETLQATLDPEVCDRIDLRPSQERFAELAGWQLEPAI